MWILHWINLALRALMEMGIVLALGYWGFQAGGSSGTKILLGIGAPLIGFGFWGLVDFRKAGAAAEYLRLTQELVISGAAAWALYSTGAHEWGWALGLFSLVHHGLVYLTGQTLLKATI